MIAFRNLTEGPFRDITFEIGGGHRCLITTGSDAFTARLTPLLLGIRKPAGGAAFLFGENLALLAEKETIALCRKVGVVWQRGGLISNLKSWENAVLPVWYHRGRLEKETEERLVGYLVRLGIGEDRVDDLLQSPVSALTPYETRVVSMARAMLMDPDLMIYESPFKGMGQEEEEKLGELARWFHGQRPERTSLFINSDLDTLGKGLMVDMVVSVEGSGGEQ